MYILFFVYSLFIICFLENSTTVTYCFMIYCTPYMYAFYVPTLNSETVARQVELPM